MASTRTDVLIIGGGPAGSTIGTLIRARGWEVTLLEKEHHPRFHIGESLLPMNVPILERLGVLDGVREIGVPKFGADFTIAGSGDAEKTFYFSDALGDSPPHAFEVRRSEFDERLFKRCRDSGVHALEGMRVQQVARIDEGRQRVTAIDTSGAEHRYDARFVVDASGRDTFLAGKNGWKRRDLKHASAAIFGHFRGVERRPGKDAGNISLYWFDYGWIWMIPLKDDVMSIGAVCRPEYLKKRSGSIDEHLLATLAAIPEIKRRMRNSEPTMPAQATGNYSYKADRMSLPGQLIIGDAYSFIDPVFSSGVYLAMNSAEHGVDVVDAWLSGQRLQYALASWRLRRRVHRGLSTFSWFIYRFTTPTMADLMSNPRNVLHVVQAIISMLAGDVFTNRRVRRRLFVFKTIYTFAWLGNWRASLGNLRVRNASVRAAAHEAD